MNLWILHRVEMTNRRLPIGSCRLSSVFVILVKHGARCQLHFYRPYRAESYGDDGARLDVTGRISESYTPHGFDPKGCSGYFSYIDTLLLRLPYRSGKIAAIQSRDSRRSRAGVHIERRRHTYSGIWLVSHRTVTRNRCNRKMRMYREKKQEVHATHNTPFPRARVMYLIFINCGGLMTV